VEHAGVERRNGENDASGDQLYSARKNVSPSCCYNFDTHEPIFRSTPPSRPNNIRGGNVRPSVGTSVRPYVRPQKVCPISMKFRVYIEVDE